jgi:hypothetical protein
MRRLSSLLCCCFLGASADRLIAAERASFTGSNAPIVFDIGPQPLPQALDHFSAVTGIEVLLDARNAEGVNSIGVKGVMAPSQALAILLRGSVLVAEEFMPGTIALMKPVPPSRDETPTGAGMKSADPPYFALIQRAVLRALCRDDLTAPGGYRLALKLQVDPSGAVVRARRLDSTGDAERDRIVDATLSSLVIGEPPPPQLPQPVAVVVQPQIARDPVNCPATDKVRRASGQ